MSRIRTSFPWRALRPLSNALAVSSQTPAKNLAEYVAWAKAGAKRGTIGIPAPASTPEFLVKILAEHYKLDLVAAPYRGSAPCWRTTIYQLIIIFKVLQIWANSNN